MNEIRRAFFVTGTDTGIGKTHATCTLIHATRQIGLSAVGMKPIASGIETDGRNRDVVNLLSASSILPPLEWVNPFLYTQAIAPHIAASEEGRPIDIEIIKQAFNQLRRLADVVWIEGVGGFRVPIDNNYDSADLAEMLNVPIILVVGIKLGCISHALLTAEAISNRNLKLIGWVANQIDPKMLRFEDNIESLRLRLNTPLIGIIPFGCKNSTSAREINLSVLSDLI